jgi:hypothetical protein
MLRMRAGRSCEGTMSVKAFEVGKMYQCKNNKLAVFMMIEILQADSNGVKSVLAFFPSIGRVVPQPIWSDDEWEELETP